MPKTLFIIPCSGGAKDGDYMKGVSWQRVKKFLDASRISYKLAAVDSIITKRGCDNLGAIVLYPEEMHRVAGYDSYPSWDLFVKDGFRFLYEHAECVYRGLKRVSNSFKRFAFVLNVRGYRLATYWAIKKLWGGIPEGVVFVHILSSPAWLLHGIKLAAKAVREEVWGVVTSRKAKVKFRAVEVPPEFRYWEHENIKEIDI